MILKIWAPNVHTLFTEFKNLHLLGFYDVARIARFRKMYRKSHIKKRQHFNFEKKKKLRIKQDPYSRGLEPCVSFMPIRVRESSSGDLKVIGGGGVYGQVQLAPNSGQYLITNDLKIYTGNF